MPAQDSPPLSRVESLKTVVIRNPKVTFVPAEEGGRLEMTVTVMGGSWLARLFGRGTPEERTRKMQLDKMGAFCWEQCDGKRAVEEVTKALAEHEDITLKRAEESLWNFLRMLSVRGLVALSMPKPTGDAGGAQSTEGGASSD